MPSQTFQCEADCLFINNTPGATWRQLRNAAAAVDAQNTGSSGQIRAQQNPAGVFQLDRVAFAFNTAEIPNAAKVKAWTLGIPSYGVVHVPQPTRVHVCKGAYTIPCTADDFSRLRFSSYGSRDAAEWPTTDLFFEIPGTRMSLINKRGLTKLFAITEFDLKNKAPSVVGEAYEPLYMRESGHVAYLKVDW